MNKQLIKSPSFKQIIDDNFMPLVENVDDVKGIIYRATNVINGKVYIGQTTKSLEERMHKHANSLETKFIFQRAIEKYGIDNFEIEIVDVFYSKEECIEKEKLHIWLNDSWENRELGYNLTPGGEWGDTISHHPDREKIIERVVKTSRERGLYKSGKENHFYGRNDQCYGIVNFSKNRRGKTNIEVYGEEKAHMISASQKEAKQRRKDNGIKIKRKENIPISNEFILFVLSYGVYDESIDNFEKLYLLFSIGNKTVNAIRQKAKKRFPEKVKQLNSIFRSRQTAGEKNGRYSKTVSDETRTKISNSNKGKVAYNRILKSNSDLNRLIDLYFEKDNTEWIAAQLNTNATSIRHYLKQLNLPVFHYKAKQAKLEFFKNHTKEEYYVK